MQREQSRSPQPGQLWQLHFGAPEAPEPFGSGRRLLFVLAVGGKWVTAANPASLDVGKVHVEDWPRHRPALVDGNARRALRRLKARRALLRRLGVPFARKTLRRYLRALERGLS